MQTKRQSLIETCTNTGVGMVGSFLITFTCVSLIPGPVTCSVTTVLGCTAWNLVRGYAIRRYYNQKSSASGSDKPTIKVCEVCHGKGIRYYLQCHVADDEYWDVCDNCKGTGRQPPAEPFRTPCPECKGTEDLVVERVEPLKRTWRFP